MFHYLFALTRINRSIMKESAIIIVTQSQASAMLPDCNATYIAVGKVCVRPGIFPAIINVAPNSPRALAKLSSTPVINAPFASGRLIFKNT